MRMSEVSEKKKEIKKTGMFADPVKKKNQQNQCGRLCAAAVLCCLLYCSTNIVWNFVESANNKIYTYVCNVYWISG